MRIVVAGLLAGLSSAAAAAEGPSFDCRNASGEIEQIVCATPQLAAFDRELARLYALAAADPALDAAARNTLAATERGWIKGRDDCWKDEDRVACVRGEYATRIAEIRAGSAAARGDDDAGISLGPFATTCTGLDAAMAAAFVNADPGVVFLRWGDTAVVLEQAISASGARYAATLPEGDYLFWVKGRSAMFEAPGISGTLDCTLAG